MKVLLVDSSYPINTRNIRIVESLRKRLNQSEVHIAAWNRDGRFDIDDKDIKYHVFEKKAAYGNPLQKLIALFSYFFYLKRINASLQPKILIASHWDMLLLCSLLKSKDQKLVYENLDLPTAESSFVRKILDALEKRSLKNTDLIIFASRFFQQRYDFFSGSKVVIENLPITENALIEKKYFYESDKLKISFIGTVRYFDVMKNLVDSIVGLDVEVLFWGDGPDFARLKAYTSDNTQVKIFGSYEYNHIRDIYEVSDLVWAVYPSLDYNVKYAISNKFYECFKYCRPGIFATDTCLADVVKHEEIGFTVNPYDQQAIRKLIADAISNPELINKYKTNLGNFKGKRNWEDNESTLVNSFESLLR
ncbi:glycosyltransferase [Sphingobacterium sp. 18053]|uniref:glycosyltransferase n=1 Tax=Sphingobacterium sp. 18053 TaxID=2681401 RepID=UPI00135B4C06|nr:glycosyltransferase [Sphingobacterium sp. 18053]